jgi:acyl-homoserine-lactone acylase
MTRWIRIAALAGCLVAGGCASLRAAGHGRADSERAEPVPVRIDWDRYQVPHIQAETREGIAYGYGWAQLRAYPEELLRLYAVARGRGAEAWGERYRSSDRVVRTLGLPGKAEAALAAADPELRAELEAFARGMNAYAKAHPERIPKEARAVLPVRASDPLAHGHRVLLCFLLLTGQRPLIMSVDGEVAPWVSVGSNAWAIGPSRSQSGHAMLLANPHLPWGPAALRFFEAHLQGPDAPLYGVTLLGFPVTLIGFNDAIAWSHTVNVLDAADLYALVPEGADAYRWDGGMRRFEEHTETVRVRQEDGSSKDEPLRIRRTVHGPVIELTDGTLLAVRTGLDDVGTGWLESWSTMGRARTLEQFEGALETMQVPMFTAVYADRDGHVLYLSAGRIPKREVDFFTSWSAPLPGDQSSALWDELLPYEALPRVVDPPSGFVQNGNSAPWLATVPSPFPRPRPAGLAPSWPLGMREIHGLRLLLDDESITFDELRAMRYSSRLELADHVLDELVLAALAKDQGPARWAGEVLAAWDRKATASSRGVVLFEAWVRRAMSRPEPPFAVPWSEEDPVRTPWGLADPEAALRDLEAAAREVWAQHGRLDPAWGEVARLRDDLPGVGGSGQDPGSFHVMDYEPNAEGQLRPAAGDTFVAIVELRPEGPRAEVMLAYGNASASGPYAGDDLELMAAGRMREPLLRRDRIEAEAIETVELDARPR